MARMRLTVAHGRRVVRIRGSFTARDLRKFERLCGPALEQRTLPLTVRVGTDSRLDDSAQAYLDRLVARGAVVQFR
jgi:hypothetical protein